ncbi:MAG: pirin family protein [Cytophagales bacterium]
MSNTVLHKSETRGLANHGWLHSYHTFSFSQYYNPERIHFGALRVLNDDTVSGGMGFGTHPHNNMEIISIPLEGDLEHKDSMGNTTVIRKGDVQVMSAGTGIYHSEYNKNSRLPVKFLQIWIVPNKQNVTPRYDQITLPSELEKNKLIQILSPNSNDEGVWIHQNAWFNLLESDNVHTHNYQIHDKANGVYFFVISGKFEIEGQLLNERDGLGIWDVEDINIKSLDNGLLLMMEVPMITL